MVNNYTNINSDGQQLHQYNSDGQQLHQYQQTDHSPFTSNN